MELYVIAENWTIVSMKRLIGDRRNFFFFGKRVRFRFFFKYLQGPQKFE